MKFIGWTTDGNDLVTPDALSALTYTAKTTYYAVYEADPTLCKVTLVAGDGTFEGGATEKVLDSVPFGRLTADLEKPEPHAGGLVFSHYEDENGYPVTAIEEAVTLYARYARPVSTPEDLLAIHLAPGENYVLMRDIILGGRLFDEDDLVPWTALGANAENGFSGTFNGNGHKISVTAMAGTKYNFGFFHKVSGTVYNLSVVGYFSILGETDATSLGAFCGEVTSGGRIIDCQSFTRFTVSVTATKNLSVSGGVGTNGGLIDGLMVSASGQVDIDSDRAFTVGAAVGTNTGRMKNVNQSGRGGTVYVSLARSLNGNIGSFVGYNAGTIENSFSERAIMIHLAQGDNVYLENSVLLGGFVGKNDGTIRNATGLYGKLEYSVGNLTLFGEGGLYLSYDPYGETPCYRIMAVGRDDQGITYTTKYVIYTDENAVKKGSTDYVEYTLSEFCTAHLAEAAKIGALRRAVAFGSFAGEDCGETDNTTVIETIGTGNGVELVASCGFDGIKWNYLTRLHDTVYGG